MQDAVMPVDSDAVMRDNPDGPAADSRVGGRGCSSMDAARTLAAITAPPGAHDARTASTSFCGVDRVFWVARRAHFRTQRTSWLELEPPRPRPSPPSPPRPLPPRPLAPQSPSPSPTPKPPFLHASPHQVGTLLGGRLGVLLKFLKRLAQIGIFLGGRSAFAQVWGNGWQAFCSSL